MYVLSISIGTEKEYRKEGTEAYSMYGLEHGTPTRIETRARTTKNVTLLQINALLLRPSHEGGVSIGQYTVDLLSFGWFPSSLEGELGNRRLNQGRSRHWTSV